MTPLLLLGALVPEAYATVTRATAVAQPTNVLRYEVSVTTTERSRVAVQVWPFGSPSTSGWTSPWSTSDARTGTVTVWGLAPGTRYNYRVLVNPVSGADYTDTRTRSFTTAALPTSLPTVTTTTYAGAPDFDHLMFHARGSGLSDGGIQIVDAAGVVRWYQEPPTAGETFTGSWYAEDEQAVYAIVGMDRVVRYGLDGALTLDWDTTGTLADYVHHEVISHDGIVYVLTVRDADDGTHYYAEDGIQGYDATGNLVYEWWSGGVLDTTTNPPAAWSDADYGYGEVWPGILDWTHANSLQVREETDGLKAYVSFRNLSQVAKVDMATGGIDWLMGQYTGAASRLSNDFTLDASGVSTAWWSEQHHAHYEEDGTFLLFDNGQRTGSRGVELTIDETSGVATIDRAVDFGVLEDADFDGRCEIVGSAYRTGGGHMVLNCGPAQLMADFDSADVLQWTLEVNTTATVWRATPIVSFP